MARDKKEGEEGMTDKEAKDLFDKAAKPEPLSKEASDNLLKAVLEEAKKLAEEEAKKDK